MISSTSQSTVYLVGNPNAGKSSLFNLLTGLRAKVANYPGVTVEKKSGTLQRDQRIAIIDLPGIYSLSASSKDEKVTLRCVESEVGKSTHSDAVIAVVDATQMKKGLYLVADLKQKHLLSAIVLTMADLVPAQKAAKITQKLSERIGVPIFFISTIQKTGLASLEDFLLSNALHQEKAAPNSRFPLREETTMNLDLIESIHAQVDQWLDGVDLYNPTSKTPAQIDRVVLHSFYGPALLFFVFFVLFEGLFFGSKPIIAFMDEGKSAFALLVKDFFGQGSLLGSLIADGFIGGVGSVLSFVPLIGFLFLFLGALEDSGYMARAVFLLHKTMSRVGLSGKAFVPLVSGFSCSVPAIMSTRIMDSWSERLVTILVTPLISCSARLPIYSLLIAVAFSHLPPIFGFMEVGGLVMLGMYIFSIILTFSFAAIFRKFLVKGNNTPLIMELPDYRWPRPQSLWLTVKLRVGVFLKEAGTVILAVTIVLWALFTFPNSQSSNSFLSDDLRTTTSFAEVSASQLESSYAGRIGHFIEPAIAPLGFDWKIGIGLVASLAAREVFISTFGLINGLTLEDDSSSSLAEAMRAAHHGEANTKTYSPLVAMSLLVFFAISLQCMSTFAVTKKETGSWKWPLFQLGYLNTLAWVLSFIVFQGGQALGF